jgi:hypothetical protein
MTREDVVAMAHKANINVHTGKSFAENVYIATLSRFAAVVAQHEREAFPDLDPVIAWLENGCDPKEAAKELRLYAEAIRKARGKA